LDQKSSNDTFPKIQVEDTFSTVAHEAKVGKINENDLFYLQSRGINKKEAEVMMVNGFISPVIKALPLEYAAEMNVLIDMEIEK
jgi:Fe-S cluster assembly protein SufB